LMLTPGRAVSGRTAPRYVTRPTVRGVGPSPPLANFFGTRADVVCATAAAATLRGRDAEGAAAAAAARRGFQTAPPRCSPVLGRGRVSRRWRPRWGARQPRACGCRICGGRSAVCAATMRCKSRCTAARSLVQWPAGCVWAFVAPGLASGAASRGGGTPPHTAVVAPLRRRARNGAVSFAGTAEMAVIARVSEAASASAVVKAG